MPKKKYKFIDLFAGLGGFHFALSELGHECVFASELREDLRKLYAINFPGTRIEGDITKINPHNIPHHDILCAGFPCQPFSQAGKRQGFNDEKERGNLFYYICDIIDEHHPKYVFLENVANLKGHDNGNTWHTIKRMLEERGYVVNEKILSPHQFGIPQHRKRIYIVGIQRNLSNSQEFHFPEPTNEPCNINDIIDKNDKEYIKLKPQTREQLAIWQEFIDQTIAHGQKMPHFPIWAMEFGAKYEYKNKAPAFCTTEQLKKMRGQLGKRVEGETKKDCLECLPIYARTNKSKTFPDWKISYINRNREFYNKNKEWLDLWIEKVKHYDNSFLKLEWNCGDVAKPTLQDKIIQFRASGIRVKLPNYSPALNLVGTQTPIFPWVKLPKGTLQPGEPNLGRYMTLNEAAKLQGMGQIKFKDKSFALSLPRSLEALGNAVNVTIVKHIANNLIKV